MSKLRIADENDWTVLVVADDFDSDNELELFVNDDSGTTAWLTLPEVVKLHKHLGEVIERERAK